MKGLMFFLTISIEAILLFNTVLEDAVYCKLFGKCVGMGPWCDSSNSDGIRFIVANTSLTNIIEYTPKRLLCPSSRAYKKQE